MNSCFEIMPSPFVSITFMSIMSSMAKALAPKNAIAKRNTLALLTLTPSTQFMESVARGDRIEHRATVLQSDWLNPSSRQGKYKEDKKLFLARSFWQPAGGASS